MFNYVKNLQTERDNLTAAANNIAEVAAREERDVTETERATLTSMSERCATIDGQLTTFGAQIESQRAYAKLRLDLADADDREEPRTPERRSGGDGASLEVRGWGASFVESTEFRAYDGRGSSALVTVPGLFDTRAPIDTGGIGGLPRLPFTPNIPQPARTTPLLDAVGHMTSNSNLIEWLVDDQDYPDAAVVPEGQPKPESSFTLKTLTGTLQTYAHWKGITRQALANLPLIQSIVETQLRGGIYAKIEDDIATALGAATLETVDGSGGTLEAIRVALGTAQAAGFPNARSVLLNPADWAALDVDVMGATNNGPTAGSAFWGLSPIASNKVPAGTLYVGDVSQAITLFDQGQAAVFMSDSHADNFIRNVLVILAEVMALPLVTQPKALVEVTTTAAPGNGGGA
jgi:HK97 family phage major capsid protein